MANHHFSAKKIADVEALLPGFAKVWPAIKAACHTTQRCPKSITFSDEPSPVYANDYDCCKRFSLDLRDMSLSNAIHVSCGEGRDASRNYDGAVEGVPSTHAVLTCTYNDYYRSFSLTVLVARLPAQIAAVAS